ncbi:MAG: NAD-dependent epimerase/dehydratase family protein [Gemmatimonadetes bacterium]|uniref:NAD-dependent epimerase/dehydratase family protein n=1 Tax=Candidatus Kutchimonas denitrificans TaxID=3056748 RepID=A0AAE5C7W3_9BACT|nr:NAD-dependent epimerase/dehydratase family protein [Gemmatimonadota bacterium]NIR73906.1 NAD-dependent epimerase/dehydratase family protein [Candidatus Kutchimonas denitrificans]NIR99712.1 NAD-dependent epimerase/dehydratase family protein [Gemmatimonadota bacterium]NIT65297.1 NAD-dependent epimerase/dehydratase family protein [Gemmatimonadota bacterium]NIW73746.1 NAD-dependent epimerase/dehydratase family protein [Gemmatimonadota bacterium]
MSKRVLVTGGAGFIGSHVAEAYLADGWQVTVVDNLSTGKRRNVPEAAEFVELDVRDDSLRGIFEERGGFELINHHAAQIDVRTSVAQPRFDADINLGGLLNVLESGREFGARRVVFVSSGGVVYGDAEERPIPETAPKRPESPYGVSKLASEYYLRCFQLLHDLDYVALRYSNVYGPRQDPHGEAGVVAIFSNRIIAGEPLTIFGDGEQTRDYVYVGDVVEANMVVSKAEFDVGDDSLDARAFNVGTGIETSVVRLAAILMQAAGVEVELEHAPARAGELKWNSLNCEKLRALGWEAAVDLSEGLQRTYQWIAGQAT